MFTHKEPDDVSIIEVPYGGRLVVVMPEGNILIAHLKDKSLIRNKKRWSQVPALTNINMPLCKQNIICMRYVSVFQIMYLYYLLGWKGFISKNPQKIKVGVNLK